MQRKLVIGYDPADHGADALALGRLLGDVLGARPIVTTVAALPDGVAGGDGVAETIEREASGPFARAAEALAGLDPEFRALPHSSPAAALHELAEAEDAMAIVLGSARRGPVGRTVLGSVGESLLQGAPCAVAVAPAEYAERSSHKLATIAVAFDGSPEAENAIDSAVALALRTHARLTLLTVAEYPRYGLATALAVLTEAEYRDAELHQKRDALDRGLERVPEGVDAAGDLRSGEPGTILKRASSEFDLMVCGSRGYGPLRRTLLGSATRELLASAASPVLVLARDTKIESLGAPGATAADAGP